MLVGWHMASSKQEDFAKWHVLLFLCYILIFWAQKCWFIELNLMLSSDAVCLCSKAKLERFHLKIRTTNKYTGINSVQKKLFGTIQNPRYEKPNCSNLCRSRTLYCSKEKLESSCKISLQLITTLL